MEAENFRLFFLTFKFYTVNLGQLYLVPTYLAPTDPAKVFPAYNTEIVSRLKYFIVENIRTARRYLKSVNKAIDIDSLTFMVLNKHTSIEELSQFLNPLYQGNDVAILSEAGCPCVADPGAMVVDLAHKRNIKINPLIGPSSILLGLMSSGFNGQNFSFHGYIPIDKNQRSHQLRHLEKDIYAKDQTQIFIETPFRNDQLLNDILHNCRPSTKLCIAADVTGENAFIQTKTIAEWKKLKSPNLKKIPTVFLMYK